MLTEKNVIEVLKHIADSDEKCAKDVMYAMTLLDTNIGKMLESVKGQMVDNLAENKFDSIDKLNSFCNNIVELHSQVESCIDALIVSSDNAKKVSSTKEYKQQFIDYSAYTVDSNEAHLLIEDFENKKVCAVNFTGRYCEVKNWKDAIVKLCEDLYKMNPSKFRAFLSDNDFKGKRMNYFSDKPLFAADGRPRSMLVSDSNIYVYTNISANDAVKFIKKILSKFDIPLNNCVVYLRADYSPLHN